MDSYGFLLIPMDSSGFLWIPMNSFGCLWIPMGSCGASAWFGGLTEEGEEHKMPLGTAAAPSDPAAEPNGCRGAATAAGPLRSPSAEATAPALSFGPPGWPRWGGPGDSGGAVPGGS